MRCAAPTPIRNSLSHYGAAIEKLQDGWPMTREYGMSLTRETASVVRNAVW
jgi:hypothetical protein